MTRTAMAVNSKTKELDKLNAQLERAKNSYEKKLATAQKLGVAEWTCEDRNEWLTTVKTTEFGYIIDKADAKKNGAWFDLFSAKHSVEDIEDKIERAKRILSKYMGEYGKELEQETADEITTQRSELMNRYIAPKLTEEEVRAIQENIRAEWAKDGITITEFYGSGLSGLTPNGKKFNFYGNSGITERSWHCYTLNINGYTMFTSGTVCSCYKTIKRS